MATTKSVPMYLPPGFNLTYAQTCAAMVSAAYDQYNQWIQADTPKPGDFDWTWTGPSNISNPLPIWWIQRFLVSEPIGFLATDGAGNAYLVFRGTMSLADKAADADFAQSTYELVSGFGNAYQGYYYVYTNLVLPTASTGSSTTLIQAINGLTGIKTFFFTGHSMGSGISSLAVPDVSTNSNLKPSSSLTMLHYNFASPRAGNVDFASAMNFSSGVPTYRVVNTEDIVPYAPPPETELYEHIGTPVDFTANYGSIDGNHSMANSYAYAVNNPTNPYNSNAGATPHPADGTGALARRVTVAPVPLVRHAR
jgi:triacylglycerol lipase